MDQREEEIVCSLLDRMVRLRERIEVYSALVKEATIEHAELKSKLQVRFRQTTKPALIFSRKHSNG